MKKRQPNNHDSLTAIRSSNKSNKRPERSIPNNQRYGLCGREGGKKKAVKRGNEDKTVERANLKNKSKARLDLKLEECSPFQHMARISNQKVPKARSSSTPSHMGSLIATGSARWTF